ncbi:MAG: sensor domain-containing diguanylate cyclase [Candidatus Omnitrophica bacterium]|nr:sensor domain-containing diguanylate cyclase [Candidatus Omnitrophota bacterium]
MKIIIYILFFLLYIFLPVYLARLHYLSVKSAALFCLINIFILFYFVRKNLGRINQARLKIQDLQEQINIIEDDNRREVKNKGALGEKASRYRRLKDIIEEINQDLDLETIADKLAALTFSLVADNKGTCLLYLTDPQAPQALSLFKTKKEVAGMAVKSKEGDIFDSWVLKRGSPLLITEAGKDFRFDLEKLESDIGRPFSSLISAPLVGERRILGILRLDHPRAGFYAQDDLRFLMAICELGALALENGELFKRTQDLAIHDELTSLYTRGYFLERLKEECSRSLRQNRGLSLLMLDIDYFKNYNDKFGHMAGDIVLKALSAKVVEGLRDFDHLISRFGGEEFCVVILGLDKKKAYGIAEELRSKIEKTKIILRRKDTGVTVSIGVAAFGEDAKDEKELILKADRAMYEAKQKGRNTVVCSL